MQQVNLNAGMNAFSTKIRFIEPFKDLNYMVFTSGVKSVETEAYDITNDVLSGYDPRFIVDGLDIVGVAEGSTFKQRATIPQEVVNIKSFALAYLEKVDDYVVAIDVLSSSMLANIEPYAF